MTFCYRFLFILFLSQRGLDIESLFHKPVIEAVPQVKDAYLKKIATPMDFGTIEKQLRKYDYMSQIQQDIILVYRNCCDFNGLDSEYGQYAM